MKTRLLFDFFVVSLLICFAFLATLSFELQILPAGALIFGVPALYMLVRKPRELRRTFFGTLFIGGLLGFIVSYLGHVSNAWLIAPERCYFAQMFIPGFPVDEFLMGILCVFMVIVFYEHFFERERSTKLSKNYVPAVGIAFAALVAIAYTKFYFQHFAAEHYGYLFIGLLMITPLVYVFWRRPHLGLKLLQLMAFFVPFFFVYDLLALHLGWWQFTGSYLGTISLHGLVFPIEEFFFWMVVCAMAIAADYELYVDDEK